MSVAGSVLVVGWCRFAAGGGRRGVWEGVLWKVFFGVTGYVSAVGWGSGASGWGQGAMRWRSGGVGWGEKASGWGSSASGLGRGKVMWCDVDLRWVRVVSVCGWLGLS